MTARPLSIAATDGTIDATLFTPDGVNDPLPAVVMFTDIGGVRPSYHDKAQAVADAGYAVLLPNIYYRSVAGQTVPQGKSFRDPEIRQQLVGYAALLTPDAQARDFTAILAAIRADAAFAPGHIGVVGYCMTGSFALRMAALMPDDVAASAGFHSAWLAADGHANNVLGVLGSIRARVYLGHADKDEYLPAAEIGQVDEALASFGVHFQTELYRGALHGFTSSDSPAYDAIADALHRKRLFTLLDETLKGNA